MKLTVIEIILELAEKEGWDILTKDERINLTITLAYKSEGSINLISDKLSLILLHSFNWEKTSQSVDYWDKLHSKLDDAGY